MITWACGPRDHRIPPGRPAVGQGRVPLDEERARGDWNVRDRDLVHDDRHAHAVPHHRAAGGVRGRREGAGADLGSDDTGAGCLDGQQAAWSVRRAGGVRPPVSNPRASVSNLQGVCDHLPLVGQSRKCSPNRIDRATGHHVQRMEHHRPPGPEHGIHAGADRVGCALQCRAADQREPRRDAGSDRTSDD